ncbi:TPA: phosphotriesterase [Kluyvera ascorbata]|uniref:Aryldialkylphosphatase n=1 Tax=Kluyvera genomosp. 2 TaxID=2774054 RepID=A0A2T2Y670_9ENTR|nr:MULTISPECIES: aryldialkylphosphatase [Enterobacteriaceae]HAT3917337.1 phosphotriesterase [Kluyvera ascorbata]PSR48036.1 aryldialkylphosphatase [Kluyvera genomosp. 2]BBQ84624.1 phosphotriesterase [Klebsiella sp. WP3-W18-ESBL-02]BBR21675.1 phosphotriesterase [Klebsiella sp. WP3-S18-ESBL-05]HAT3942250.1 phosphotriesterase [Kluyvera ascorbata]
MTRVNTVLGTISAAELGFVAIHEHIGYGMPGCELDSRWWKTPEARYEETVPKLRLFRENARPWGAATFVEATGICNGRDIDYYKSLSDKTGVHIVASTGFVGGDTALPFFEQASVEYLTDQFVHEITVGIGKSGAKAGIIKVGVSRGFKMKALDKRIYRAAARASRISGAPIFTHLSVDSQPALDIFAEEGLPCHRVLFGHADDGVSQGKINEQALLASGARIGFDTFGYDLELPDPPFWGRHRQERLQHFLRFLREGRVHQILASADANCSPLGWPGVKGHTVNYLFEQLIPDLQAEGIGAETIDKLFIRNTAEFLTLQPFSDATPQPHPGV